MSDGGGSSARVVFDPGSQSFQLWVAAEFVDLGLKVGEIVRWQRGPAEELLEDGQEVAERADGIEGRGVKRPEAAAGGGESEGGFEYRQGDAAAVELIGELAVLGPDPAEGSRGVVVGL